MKNHESNEHADLEELQDGAIIGDGRSDSTLETKSYTFKHNDQSFVLLDVPGIESDEKKVKEQISNATKKAHAIFYATKTPASPQKGEEGKEGTIEKIQKQLDSQTEVYTLFNKPINNPRALKDGLIDANEKESLRDLNEKMRAILGKHYEGHQIVSAQAAFYGLSSALLPETDFYKNKQKFLEIFKAEELLLYKSHFKQLGEFIAGTLLENSRKKIIESNCNKALKVIEKLQKAIATTIDREIDPTIKELEDAQPETYDKLDYSRDKFVSNLNNSVSKEIERFKTDFRIEMYERIEKDIGNKECEEIFENECEQRIETLRENIERCFNECKEQFSKDTKEDIEQFEERIKDSLVMLNHINLDSGFDLIFNIASGIDKLGLFSSIGGLILLLTVSVLGEIALAAGIVLGAIGVVKSLWSFLVQTIKNPNKEKKWIRI
ncbi:ancestral polypeptide [Helicobacter pylori]|nr:ancestral polypeptide [Helicobacter pylori]